MPLNLAAPTSENTKEFYDGVGWSVVDGKTGDEQFFGDREAGPIRMALRAEHAARVRDTFQQLGSSLNLLEVGCGGNPATMLLDLCAHYTGVDFSRQGLTVAHRRLASHNMPFELREASATALPFADRSFDAV